MDAIRIPVDAPVTFEALRRLNPECSAGELAEAFGRLPRLFRDEAWAALRLRIELEQAGGGE